MIRPLTLLTMIAAMGAGLHLYQTKHEVAQLDRTLREIGRAVETAGERTLALNAEWAWLNEPERLRQNAERYLRLEPMQPTQFVRLAELERRLPQAVGYDGPPAFFAARREGQAEEITPDLTARGPAIALLGSAPLLAAAAVPATPPSEPVGNALAAPHAAVPPRAPAGAASAGPGSAVDGAQSAGPGIALAAVAAPAAAIASASARPASVPQESAATTPRAQTVAASPPRPPAAPRPVAMSPAVAALAPIAAPSVARPPATTAAPRPAVASPAPAQAAGAPMMAATAPAPAAPAFSGSLLGGAASRPSLAPPVPFGSANAATLSGAGITR